MKTQNIEVEVPEGMEIDKTTSHIVDENIYMIRLQKIQPRRIVLEETEDRHLGCQTLYINDTELMIMTDKVWREVKETDIPLTNEVKMGVSQGDGVEPNLELSVKELRNVLSLIKDFENLGWFINPEIALLLQKITEFIKDK